ncbi:MAG: hypothetical protein LBK12_02565 [Odoribacteraceae bacterium]|jgi:hypothetical protein|nr:hypothetical protein [Odoribacteraceae bacterium]
MKHFWHILICIPFLVTACVRDISTGMPQQEETDEQLRVKFVMHVSGQQTPGSRAMNANAENTIARVDVLAFKVSDTGTETYDYLASATDITGVADENTKQFTVRLLKSDDNYRFVLVTNLPDSERQRLYHLTGQGKDEVLSSILYTHPGKWTANGSTTGQFTPLPMWAETGIMQVDDDLAADGIPGVSLTRALAKFEVSVTTQEARDVFTVEKVYLYNRASRGRVVPVKEKWYASSPKASMPDDDDPANNPLVIRGPLEYDVPGASAHAFTREIYMFETAAPANPSASLDATCIVVGGIYGNATERSYYRLDLKDLKDKQSNYRDILRNHAYAFNIVKVSGPGYPTPEQAFRSAPVNIEAEVVEWNEGKIPNVLFDGQHILGLSHSSFEFFRDAQTDNEEVNKLVVFTDYQSSSPAESGWKAGAITYDDAATGTDWLTLSTASGAANVETNLYLYLQQNTTGVPRTCSFLIEAGRLKYRVEVEQLERAAIGISIVDEERKSVEQIVFAAFTGQKPAARKFTVQWQPKDVSLSTLATNIGPGMTLGQGQPVAGNPLSGGSVTFTVAPAAITPGPSESPFIERTTLYTFSINTEGQRIVKNILLQHINRATVTDLQDKMFLMDGTTQSFNVKANFPWKIELFKDELGLLATNFTVQYGGNNTGKGDQVSFKLKDFISNYNPANPTSGTITLRLSQRNEKNQYEEVATYNIECIAAILHGNSNSYMVKPNGLPILIPLTQVKRAMLGTASYLLPTNWITNANFSKLSVKVLWQDQNVSFDNANSVVRRIQLLGTSIEDAKILLIPGTREGNAGLALFENGVIKWSWHIWNTSYIPGDGTATNPITSPAASSNRDVPGGKVYRFKGTGNTDYVWMDRNLGASATTSNELVYQWGRKDPFPGATQVKDNAPPRTWYYSTTTVYRAVETPATVGYFNTSNAMSTPLTRYKDADWIAGTKLQLNAYVLWGRDYGNKIVDDGFVDRNTGKSAFDPCPEGWKVPPGNVDNSPWPDKIDKALMGDYAFTGKMVYNKDNYSGLSGYYWMATPKELEATPHLGNVMTYGNVTFNMSVGHENRGDANAIRCIKE